MSATSRTVVDPHLTPRLCVCDGRAALSAVRLEFAAAGWSDAPGATRHDGDAAAGTPPVLRVVHDLTSDAIAEILDDLVHGATVVATTEDEVVAVDLYDQGRRIVPAEWFDAHHQPTCLGLDHEQIALLLALRSGSDVEAAARSTNLSPRTAARRLTAARTALRARSTAEAVTIVGRRIDQLRPDG